MKNQIVEPKVKKKHDNDEYEKGWDYCSQCDTYTKELKPSASVVGKHVCIDEKWCAAKKAGLI